MTKHSTQLTAKVENRKQKAQDITRISSYGVKKRKSSSGGGVSVSKSRLTLVMSVGFPRKENWSGLPFRFPGNLSDPGIKPMSPTLQAVSSITNGFFTTEPPGKPKRSRNGRN